MVNNVLGCDINKFDSLQSDCFTDISTKGLKCKTITERANLDIRAFGRLFSNISSYNKLYICKIVYFHLQMEFVYCCLL